MTGTLPYDKNRKATDALEQYKAHAEELGSQIASSQNDNWIKRAEGWLSEEEGKIADIERSIEQIEEWIHDDEDKT